MMALHIRNLINARTFIPLPVGERGSPHFHD
jgi:hypothetical protein